MEKGVCKPITLFAPSLLLIAVHKSGGDVSIWMVWLWALSAITAMRQTATHSVHHRSRLDGQRGMLSSFTIREARAKSWSCKSQNLLNVKDTRKNEANREVQVILSNFPCLWLQMERGKLHRPGIIYQDVHKQSRNIIVHMYKQFYSQRRSSWLKYLT